MSNSLKNYRTVLHSDRTILHPHQQGRRVPISPHSCQHLFHPSGCEVVPQWLCFLFP